MSTERDRATEGVLWPRGRKTVDVRPLAKRLGTLDGITIGELWDDLFRGDEIFPLLREELARRFPGLRFVDYRPAGNALDLTEGTLNMTLIQYDGEDRPEMDEESEFIHLGFIVDDAQVTFQRLQQAGAIFLRDNVKTRDPIRPGEVPPGSFKVADPDGNVVDITDNRQEWRGAAP